MFLYNTLMRKCRSLRWVVFAARDKIMSRRRHEEVKTVDVLWLISVQVVIVAGFGQLPTVTLVVTGCRGVTDSSTSSMGGNGSVDVRSTACEQRRKRNFTSMKISWTFPSPREATVIGRLRSAHLLPVPRTRTNRYRSLIHHGLTHYQPKWT